MDYRHVIGAIAIIIQLVCIIPYFIGLFNKKIKPHGFTWLLWGSLSAITFVIQLYESAGAGAWLTGVNAAIPLMVACLAFRYGTFTITRSDWAVSAVALMAIPLWVLTENGLWSVIIVSCINILASWPTFRKTWSKPFDEFPLTFFLGGFSVLLSIAALENRNVTTFLYPLIVGLSNLSLVGIILYRRKVVNN